jgi:YVTN family beta-propeller protein
MQLSKHIYIVTSLVFIVVVLGLAFFSDRISSTSNSSIKPNQAAEKLYIALEEDGAIAIIDTKDNSLLGKIDLTQKKGDEEIRYSAHNVQVAPDGKSIWVTANFMGMGGHEEESDMSEEEETGEEFPDQVIVINPQKDSIIKRIDIGNDQHLAHIVVTRDGKNAYATAQEPGLVYKINGTTYEIEKTISLGKDAQPHGLRLAADDRQAYVALIGGKGIGVVDTKSNTARTIPLAGSVVQTAAIPNSSYIAASVYDAKQIAFYNTQTQEVSYIGLPGAEGAIQSYATPDGKFLYVADQGFYFDKPTSDYVYKIDVETKQVVATIKAGVAPHGVVVSPDGKRAYIANLLSDDVSVIDTATDKEITKIKVGKMPNGISLWSHQSGGTP